MAQRTLIDKEGKEFTVDFPDDVTISALGSQVGDIQKAMAEIRKAVDEQRGAPTFDAEPVVTDLQKQLEALRALVSDVQTRRRGDNDEKVNPGARLISQGEFRGRRYDEVGAVYHMLDRMNAKRSSLPGEMRDKIHSVTPALKAAVDQYRAYTSTGTGAGLEWMPAGDMSRRIWDDIYLSAEVCSQFPKIMSMPSDPFELPLDLGGTESEDEWSGTTEALSIPTSEADTRDSTIRTKELAKAKEWSKTFDENALFAMLPVFEDYLRRTGRESMDKLLMNADSTTTSTGNVNLDDAAPPANALYLVSSNSANGLRRQGIIDNASQYVNAGAVALTMTMINNMLSKMGKYAAKPSDVRIFTDVFSYLYGISGLAEVLTVDKYGPRATIQTGEVLKLKGSPVIVTGAIKKTEADGKISNTSGNNIRGQIVATHINAWLIGYMRGLTLESDYHVLARKLILVGSFRQGHVSFGTRSTAIHTAVIGNIALS